MGKSLVIVTPWYPGANNPFAGAFVQSAVQAVAGRFERVQVVHVEDWPTPKDRISTRRIRRALGAMLGGAGARVSVVAQRLPEAELLRVPAPISPSRDYAEHASVYEAAVRAILPRSRIDADVVHGHVGIYGGWVATRLARPGAPVFVTEHATFLDKILAQPAARALYDLVLARCTRLFCVSDALRRQLATEFPHRVDKLVVVPNAVAVERIPARSEPVTELSRWLFVGRLVPHKGVARLLEAFAVCALDDPRLELTMVGGGPMTVALASRAHDLGLEARVHLPGPVPPEQVGGYLNSHHLLVHLSSYETFGMTVVEAIAAGIPVLVTRCGGPEETLAGILDAAGTTVAVADGPADVVAAYRSLGGRLGELEPARARRAMVGRYGLEAVGSILVRHYADGAP